MIRQTKKLGLVRFKRAHNTCYSSYAMSRDHKLQPYQITSMDVLAARVLLVLVFPPPSIRRRQPLIRRTTTWLLMWYQLRRDFCTPSGSCQSAQLHRNKGASLLVTCSCGSTMPVIHKSIQKPTSQHFFHFLESAKRCLLQVVTKWFLHVGSKYVSGQSSLPLI